MEQEQQVCSLKLAKKLNKLGVKQDSLFWWAEEKLTGWNNQDWKWVVTDSMYEGDYEYYRNPNSAFTVAELGKLLPDKITEDEDPEWYYYSQYYTDSGLVIGYWSPSGKSMGVTISSSTLTEADLRAAVLVRLLEKKLKTL